MLNDRRVREQRVRFWAYPPICWIAYPPLLVVLVAVLAVVLGDGVALGAPSLVWHDQPWTQVCAGLAIAVLCGHLGMVGYLLDSRENDERTVAPEEATIGSVARYIAWPIGLLVVVVALGSSSSGPCSSASRTSGSGTVRCATGP